MKRFLLAVVMFMVLSPLHVSGEIRTFTKTIEYRYGGNETIIAATAAAQEEASRQVGLEAGAYIQSMTVMKNAMLVKDEVTQITASTIKNKLIDVEHPKTFLLVATCEVTVDPEEVEMRLKEIKERNTAQRDIIELNKQIESLKIKTSESNYRAKQSSEQQAESDKKLKEKEESLEKERAAKEAAQIENEILRNQLSGVKQSSVDNVAAYQKLRAQDKELGGKESKELQDKFIKIAQELESDRLHREGLAYLTDGTISSTKKAIEYFNQAIDKSKGNADAYVSRAFAYSKLDLMDKAISDCSEALQINPKLAVAYEMRSSMYYRKNELYLAIIDLDEAIRLNPNNAKYYMYRGLCYEKKSDKKNRERNELFSAIMNYNEAILRDPELLTAYDYRARAYFKKEDRIMGCRSMFMGRGYIGKSIPEGDFTKCVNTYRSYD